MRGGLTKFKYRRKATTISANPCKPFTPYHLLPTNLVACVTIFPLMRSISEPLEPHYDSDDEIPALIHADSDDEDALAWFPGQFNHDSDSDDSMPDLIDNNSDSDSD